MKLYLIAGACLLSLLAVVFALKKQNESLALQLDLATETVAQLEDLAQKRAALLAKRDSIDNKYTEELSRAKSEIDDLRAAVATSTKRLRVKASCPTGVSGAASSTGLDDAERPELDSAARSDYFSLRERVVTTEKRLAGLQDYVRNVCLSSKGE